MGRVKAICYVCGRKLTRWVDIKRAYVDGAFRPVCPACRRRVDPWFGK